MKNWNKTIPKVIAALAVVCAFVFLFPYLREALSLDRLASQETELRAGHDQSPILYFVVGFAAYALLMALGVPGGSAMSVITGWLFGLLQGVLLVSFASTLGAAIAFSAARFCLRGFIERRLGSQLKRFEDRFGDDCPSCLFTMRMMPGIPNLLTNVLPAFTRMPLHTFWWVSQLGMLPATIAFVYVGSTLPDIASISEKGVGSLISPQLVAGFAVLGLLPLITRVIAGKFGRSSVT